MHALIIVDVQYDFLPGGALQVPDGDQVIPVINRIQQAFPLVVATQDWHPADHGSFASAHKDKKPFDQTILGGLDQILWPDHCIQDTRGAEFAEELDMHSVEAIFRKGLDPEIDSYSGFFDNGKKKSTGLADYLRGKGVKTVYVTGLAGDFCVAFTVLDALQEGFETILVEDATRPIDPDGFASMKESIKEKGGNIILSKAI